MIVVGGMIGLGKTSVATLLGEALKSEVFLESVDDNPILPLFYTASPEEIVRKRYPYLLQLHFLNSRFEAIKKALAHEHNVLDRSMHEDWYFTKVNAELGRISGEEFAAYESKAAGMMEELAAIPQKGPDLMVYLKGSFETVMGRIGQRGRSFEQDRSLVDYYRVLWAGYDEWVMKHYNPAEMLVVDMDSVDVVHRPGDGERLIGQIRDKLAGMRQLLV
ncbi:Deoxyadenosine/deoxycytidine kinase [Paenibacillus sp. UNCCL117]|uniref:deoxynucleoside kinase n=1 Tax=unclassified Paenibacillus TaxID=185978 RepID=UPI000885FC51|nr:MULTISPECIES: deoxynucleoside kinase [unclassified Paenibacillus]SDC89954.1 Deoxyadenosine/deoxycytidine kinase [Paenibacillus sp. cl123]SFW28698.1 Deoxyadenosine/deoxycytidine kinase [Paenibacillus sp. UNCCL117]